MTMAKDQALTVVIQAAERWHNELGEYIIPASVAAEDGCDYQPAYNELGEALEVLQPPATVKVHKDCNYAIIQLPKEGYYCPQCEAHLFDFMVEERDRKDIPTTQEFRDKQAELAGFLYELYHGKGTWLSEVLLAPTHDDRYDNYMADAKDILREQTHLLTLPTVEAMAL